MSRTGDLAKNTLLLGLSKIATQMVSFLLVPIYTIFLAPDDFGYVDLIVTYISLVVPFVTIQLEFAAFRFAIGIRKDNEKLSELLSTIFALILPVALLSAVIFWAISFFVNIPYVSLILFNAISMVIVSVLLQFSRGIGQTKAFAIASVITGLLTSILSIIFVAVLHWSASSILLATAVANTVASIYLISVIGLKNKVRFKNVNLGISKDLLLYTLPLLPNNVSWWILNVSDRTIIAVVLGVGANGIYSIANKFAFIPGAIFGIFNMSWMETASLHIDALDKDKYFSKICNNAVKIYSSITLLFIVTMSIIFPYIVGHKYAEAYYYIPILAVGALAQGLVGLYSAVYIAKKKTTQIANTSLLAAIINIVINLLFVYFIGIYASAISTAIAFLAMFIFRHFDVQKYVKITYDKSLFVKLILLFALTISIYYMHNLILSIILFAIVLAISVLLNLGLITKILSIVRVKLRR